MNRNTRKAPRNICNTQMKMGREILKQNTRKAAKELLNKVPYMRPGNFSAGLNWWDYIHSLPENRRQEVIDKAAGPMLERCVRKYSQDGGALPKIKFQDYGALFLKRKDGSIWRSLYSKTDYLRKKHPEIKLTYYNFKKKEFKQTPHSPNMIWYILFDKNGRDYVSMEDSSYKKAEEALKNDTTEIYDIKDYKNPLELYESMKKSGLKSFYTKKWVKHSYDFLQGQIDKL